MKNATLSKWLVASDIDGTLYDGFRRLPKRNELAIKRFVSLGGKFTLASGRNPQSMEKIFRRLPSDDVPAVVLNGAGIYDFRKNETIYFSPVSREGTELILETAEKFPALEAMIVAKDAIYLTGTARFGRFFVAADKLDHEYVKRAEDAPRGNWGKVVFLGSPFAVSKIKKSFLSLKDPDLTFMSSSAASFEVLARDANKGTAVLKLAELLGVDRSHTAAVGNYFNDLEMLKRVGFSACCARAPKELRNVSDFIARRSGKGAVADLLERIEAMEK